MRKGTPAADGRALFLHFALPEVGNVKEATVIVHGSGYQNRVVPAATSDAPLSESFRLRPEEGAVSLLDAELTLTKIRNVESIELTELRYDNGGLWHTSSGHLCRIAPDGFLPVLASSK